MMPLAVGQLYSAGVLEGRLKLVMEGKLAEMANKLSDTLPKLTDVGSPVSIASEVAVRSGLSDNGGEVIDSVREL